jgi:lipopolysaccharide transport system ATP-binding protein
VIFPDAGEIFIDGRITGLLELGTGFDLNLSGRKNISINALLLGMQQTEINSNIEAIIEFAELGQYIDVAVRTYSSGMLMRLGFSIAIHANPHCFVVDEALSVGDARFQQKCLRKIRDFQQQGGALLYVSHDLVSVKQLCDRAIVLHEGKIAFEGTPDAAVNFYYQTIAGLGDDASLLNAQQKEGYGLKQAKIIAACLLNVEGVEKESFLSGEKVSLIVQVDSQIDSDNLNIGMMIRDRFGQDIFGSNTALLDYPIHFSTDNQVTINFTFPMNLGAGKYTITLALHSDVDHLEECQHWWDNALEFEVGGFVDQIFTGVVRLPLNVSHYYQ